MKILIFGLSVAVRPSWPQPFAELINAVPPMQTMCVKDMMIGTHRRSY